MANKIQNDYLGKDEKYLEEQERSGLCNVHHYTFLKSIGRDFNRGDSSKIILDGAGFLAGGFIAEPFLVNRANRLDKEKTEYLKTELFRYSETTRNKLYDYVKEFYKDNIVENHYIDNFYERSMNKIYSYLRDVDDFEKDYKEMLTDIGFKGFRREKLNASQIVCISMLKHFSNKNLTPNEIKERFNEKLESRNKELMKQIESINEVLKYLPEHADNNNILKELCYISQKREELLNSAEYKVFKVLHELTSVLIKKDKNPSELWFQKNFGSEYNFKEQAQSNLSRNDNGMLV
jgi:hypothetical protein